MIIGLSTSFSGAQWTLHWILGEKIYEKKYFHQFFLEIYYRFIIKLKNRPSLGQNMSLYIKLLILFVLFDEKGILMILSKNSKLLKISSLKQVC